jgi:hypothetical protein
VAVFSLHNGWNCFVFLDFVNYGPAEELLSVNDTQIGFVRPASTTVVDFLGIVAKQI